jgi:hypothetical protein
MGVLFPIDRRKIIYDLLLKSSVLVTLTVFILDTSAARDAAYLSTLLRDAARPTGQTGRETAESTATAE